MLPGNTNLLQSLDAAVMTRLGGDSAGTIHYVQWPDGSSAHYIEPPQDSVSNLAYRELLKTRAARAVEINHRNIVPTAGLVQHKHLYYVAEQAVDGVTLAELLSKGGRLDPDALLELGEQIAHALKALHAAGLVHGWVRPSAIIVTNECAFLSQCGLVQPKGEFVRELNFTSPEQLAEDKSLRPESDFFSLGSTLFAAMAGRPAFEGADRAAVANAIKAGNVIFSGVDSELAPPVQILLTKMLAADPAKRQLSDDELLEDFAAVRGGKMINRITGIPTAPPPKPAPARKKSRKALVVLTLALAIVAGAAVYVQKIDRKLHGESPQLARGRARKTTPAIAPAPAQENDAEQKASAILDEVAHEAEHPAGDAQDIIKRFREVAEKFPGTQAALKAEQKAVALEQKNSAAELSKFEQLQKAADQLIAKKQFGATIAEYDAHLKNQTGAGARQLRENIERQKSFVQTKARESYAQDDAAAKQAMARDEFTDALAIYERIASDYGIEEHVRNARRQIALLVPLVESKGRTQAKKNADSMESAYQDAAASIQQKIISFDLENAVPESERLAEQLAGTALEQNAQKHLAAIRRLLALKQKIIQQINEANPKLQTSELGLQMQNAMVLAADEQALQLGTSSETVERRWPELSDWEKYSVARQVSDTNNADDLSALGLLSLEQGHRKRALEDLSKAQRLGADVAALVARASKPPAQLAQDGEPARMLIDARRAVVEKRWLDALELLIPLKDQHVETDLAVRENLDEINEMLWKCGDALMRQDIDRDIAAGVDTPLLETGIEKWEKRGDAWALSDGRVTCDNKLVHDVELLKPANHANAYRLSVRCRVISGNGLILRVASNGNVHHDFWLGLEDKGKTGLWTLSGGDVGEHDTAEIPMRPGQWVHVKAVVTPRFVRVECAGKSVVINNAVGPGNIKYGFVARQRSHVEFEDLRLRILREQ